MSNNYELKAAEYAERYGIVTYRVTNKTMIYYQNYNNSEFRNGRWVKKPCTYKRTVNLDDMSVKSDLMSRVNSEGWDNV